MAKGQASRFFVWIILGLLIVGLAGFGATNFGGSVRVLGTVGDEEIETDAYARELQQELRALTAQFGQAVPFAQAQQFGIDRTVLSRLVNRAALDNETRAIGLSVGDEVVGEQVLEIPAFRGLDGSFDRDAYSFTLQQSGMTVAEFEDQVRDDTSRTLLQSAVVGGVSAPETFTQTIFDWARERRDITWARLTEADLAEPIAEPSEEDLQGYYEANEALFTLAEERAITYAWLTPDMILDTVEIDETGLRALYDQRISEFDQPPRRLVERLVYGNDDAAAAAMAQLESGEATFDDLVAARGLTLEDIDLGEVTEGDLGSAGAEVFALSEPGVSGPHTSPLGPALFRVNAILNAREVPFEEARELLEPEYAMDRARRVIGEMIGEVDDLLAGGATIEEVAAETELELGQIDWRPDVDTGIAAYDGFREAAFAAQESDFPEVIELEEGGLFALRIDEIRPPALQPLDEVRDRVVEGWAAEETGRQLVAQAEALAEEVRGGREMASLRVPLQTARGILRDAFIEDAPPAFVAGVFEMDPGELRVFEDAGAAALVRLDAILPPETDAGEDAELLSELSRQATQDMAGDVLDLYTRALQSRAGIQINQQTLNAVHAQFP
ncbi:MAG: SurA N-terminal domain-containing protein [Pseudomonadota bacterium]